MTDHLLAFITARLDREERVAQQAGNLDGHHWFAEPAVYDGAPSAGVTSDGGTGRVIDADQVTAPAAEHIAWHDPDWVLRQNAFLRTVVADHDECFGSCRACQGEQGYDDRVSWPCTTVRRMAALWSEHPHYRSEWAPGHQDVRPRRQLAALPLLDRAAAAIDRVETRRRAEDVMRSGRPDPRLEGTVFLRDGIRRGDQRR